MTGPLTGMRIVEVGHMLAGPYCGMLLADLGAEVIKIESAEGDIGRTISPHYIGPHNAYFASLNRNKKSVVLNLDDAADKACFHEMLRAARGLITNLRPSAIKKLGLTYSDLKDVNSDLACLALTGYGLDGPFSDAPAYDYVIQAVTGVMMMTGDPDGPPVKPGFSAVDNSAGVMGALALAAKLAEGKGGQIDVSMHDVMLSQLNYLASSYLNAGVAADRLKDGGHPYIVPAQLFPTRAGYIVLFITHDKFWKIFAEALNELEWLQDPTFATMKGRSENREKVVAAITERLKEDDADSWVRRLAPHGLVVAAVQNLQDSLDGKFVASRNMIVDIAVDGKTMRLVGNPIRMDGYKAAYSAPPLLGEHNALFSASRIKCS